jgi:hypothetical protein
MEGHKCDTLANLMEEFYIFKYEKNLKENVC